MLTYDERALIRRAVLEAWNDALRARLARAVQRRGGAVREFDTCGDLVRTLELLATEAAATDDPHGMSQQVLYCPECGNATWYSEGDTGTCAGAVTLGNDHEPCPMEVRQLTPDNGPMSGFTYDEADREILAGALRTSHTWALDALASRITSASDLEPCFDVRRRVLRMLDQLGRPLDDGYRMSNLRHLAHEHGRLDDWHPDGKRPGRTP